MPNASLVEVTNLGWDRFISATQNEGQEPEEAFKETVLFLLEEQEKRFLVLRGGVAS